tara:strand:- start:74 stop:742 length:669 start_codon:yes stop_codon:yes gene_type:complete
MKNLTLVIPTKKESESLPKFLEEIKNLTCRKMVVLQFDDKETLQSIEKFDDLVLYEQKKNGYGSAIIEGIKNCKTEYWCIINADGSMDPKYLSEMLEKCYDKDFVFGSRYKKPGGGSDDDTITTLIGNKIFSFLGNLMFNLNLTDILYTYVIGKKTSFEKLSLISSDFRFCVEFPIKAKKANLKFLDIPSYERPRIGGKKKVNAIKDGFLILFEMFRLFIKK